MSAVIQHITRFGGAEIEQERYETALIPDEKRQEMSVINLYPEKEYQEIEGFGGALTESSGYALAQMSEEKRKKIVGLYYGPDGIGYTIGRVHMDSCDFSVGNYCAVEKPDDPSFPDFSLERDAKYVQPLLRMAAEAAGKPVPLLLSPWSPPAFMKDTGVRNGGGHLKKDQYALYAKYIAKYITEYRKLGFDIACMTIQNEPLAVQTWDSCEFSPEEEKELLCDYLCPALQEAGLGDVGIYIWDHNKERVYERTRDIVDDKTAHMVEGCAFHWYTGDHFDTLQMVKEDYPDLKLIHSEGCVELLRKDVNYGNEREQALRYAHDMIGDLNAGMNRWYDWNIVLDEKGGPNHVGNFCAAPVHCNGADDSFTLSPTFFAIEHFTRYIKPGAKRIAKSSFSQEIEVTAAKNPDGSVAAVNMNTSENAEQVNLRMCGKTARISLPAKSIQTVVIGGEK